MWKFQFVGELWRTERKICNYTVRINDIKQAINERTGKHYRLPTEAEWEFAARGGRRSRGYKYSGSNDLGAVAWYDSNSGKQTHIVGTKLPNEFFIYDMLGNVLEWCHDWHDSWYYRESPYSNPAGPAEGDSRVCRGGGTCCSAKYVSLTKRYDIGPRCGSGVSWNSDIRNDLNLGLRLAL